MNFKVDDIVEITANTCYHGFEIGEKVRVTHVNQSGNYYDGENLDKSQFWSFSDSDCKAIQGELQ